MPDHTLFHTPLINSTYAGRISLVLTTVLLGTYRTKPGFIYRADLGFLKAEHHWNSITLVSLASVGQSRIKQVLTLIRRRGHC
jgi:hypothetical protein